MTTRHYKPDPDTFTLILPTGSSIKTNPETGFMDLTLPDGRVVATLGYLSYATIHTSLDWTLEVRDSPEMKLLTDEPETP